MHYLVIIYLMYLLATASPGPSNLAIMGVAMKQGRSAGLVLATGVLCGSLFWAILAAMGISALLAAYANALLAIKVSGGLYLLLLAFKSAKSALKNAESNETGRNNMAYHVLFRQGVMMHLSNPKAILAWMSIMSLGLHHNASGYTYFYILAGCLPIGAIVFTGYAVIFSTKRMVGLYQRSRRWIEGAIACLFADAGIGLLGSRI